jgi:hypothetical protein
MTNIRIPKHILDAEKWFFSQGDNLELTLKYLNKWVAVYDERIIAVYDAKERKWVKLEPDLKVDPEDCFQWFVDGGSRVY